ncbi:MAG TPA: hypothetical protein VFV38_36680 [Ktedonobacteraceae bacterium]|nr:hypothetical protein [Ktedonobacteraceae bacterium]
MANRPMKHSRSEALFLRVWYLPGGTPLDLLSTDHIGLLER